VARYETQISSVATASDFDPRRQYRPLRNPSLLYSESTVSDLTLAGEQGYNPFENMTDIKPPRPAKRQRVSEERNSRSSVGGTTDYNNQTKIDEGTGSNQAGDASTAVASKPKRVRTGCLTCRERHLKCDEGLPNCQNCRKSSRTCKRGVRLNFIDTQVQSPPMIPPTADWAGKFLQSALNRIPLTR
jgi:hypothetical protein